MLECRSDSHPGYIVFHADGKRRCPLCAQKEQPDKVQALFNELCEAIKERYRKRKVKEVEGLQEVDTQGEA